MYSHTLVITKDSVDFLKYRRGVSLSASDNKRIENVEDVLVSELFHKFPFGKIDTISLRADDLRKNISRIAGAHENIICLDPIYAPQQSEILSVAATKTENRLYIRSRNGFDSIKKQLSRMDWLKKYKNICLIDSGAKSGWTVLRVKSLLEKSGFAIKALILGICDTTTFYSLQKIMSVQSIYKFSFHDWIELHELIFPLTDKIDTIITRVSKLRFAPEQRSRIVDNVWHAHNEIKKILISTSLL